MKNIAPGNNLIRLIIISALSFNVVFTNLQAQDEAENLFEMKFNLNTNKNADNTRSLMVAFYGMDNKEKIPVFGAEISFYNVLGDENILLGEAKTSREGIANLTLPEDQAYLKGEDGYINFLSQFSGSGKLTSYEDEISVIDLKLTMELSETDDIKSITVHANAIDNAGNEIPVEEADVYFYVQGMITKLKIEEGWIEEGEYSFDFPDNLPGNKDRELTIYAMIEDSDEFGNVMQSSVSKWGVGPIIAPKKVKSLWTDMGPTWMIVLLTILLIGVWSNIIHSLYNLIVIKKEGRELNRIISK